MIPLTEQLAAGVASIDLTGVAAHALTVANNAPDEARMAMLIFTGTSTGPATVTMPPIARVGWVLNQSTNSITLTTGLGTTLTVPTGTSYLYRCDATNVSVVIIAQPGVATNETARATAAEAANTAAITAEALRATTAEATKATPASVSTAVAAEAVIRAAADSAEANARIAATGANATAAAAAQATANAALPKAGGTMTGDVNFGGHAITNAGAVSAASLALSGGFSAANYTATAGNSIFNFNNTTGLTLQQFGVPAATALAVQMQASLSNQFIAFLQATQTGAIVPAGGGSAVAYTSASDHRLKTTYGPADGSILGKLPVYDAAWNAAPDRHQPMVLAHEVAACAPWAVRGEKDATNDDGEPIMQQVDYASLVPAMLAYVQSLEKRLIALEAA